MAYHRVWSSVWTEPWDEDARYLALYLLTCDHRTTEGLYRLPKAYIATDLAWSEERVGSAFDELIDAATVCLFVASIWTSGTLSNRLMASGVLAGFCAAPAAGLSALLWDLPNR